MRYRLALLCVAAATSSTVLTRSALAQAPALDETKPAATSGDASAPPPPVEDKKDDVEYGVGIRLRNIRIPQSELELFVERAAGGVSNVGFGVDLTRRRGNVELQLGFEFEHITPAEGVWIESGADVASGDEADYILGPDRADSSLGWFTLEFTFLNHAPINKQLAFRYGGGLGLGIITGSLKRIDVACTGATNDNVEPGCVPSTLGGQGVPTAGGVPVKYDLPPVFPVVNAIVGLQYRPMPKATVNFEMGIRTMFFLGLSGSYFF